MKYFTFKLNSLQFETIKHLFNHYGWDFDDSVIGEKKSFDTVANYANEQHLQMENQSLQDTLSSYSNSYQESSSNMAMMAMIAMMAMVVIMIIVIAILSWNVDSVFVHHV